jgi:hypothetical protein
MNRLAFLTGLLFVGSSLAYLAGPSVEPPVGQGISNTITSFDDGHPEWRLLRDDRVDTTPLRFGHAVHMNPQTPKMQERLQAWAKRLEDQGVDPADIPVTRASSAGTAERWVLACTACHQADAAGRYMQPITFEQHCEHCHQLGRQQEMAVPHGSGVADFIERVAAKKVLEPKKPGARPAARPGGPKGPKVRPPADAPAKPATETLTLDEVNRRVNEERLKLWRSIGGNCAQCHGLQDKPETIVDPHIPDRWLTRSTFDHAAHRLIGCDQCHAEAARITREMRSYPGEFEPDSLAAKLAWTETTRDVMIPGIETCRVCHRPDGARHDCVSCHLFHGTEGAPSRAAAPNQPHDIDDFAP